MGRAFFLRIPGRMARVRGIGMVMIWVLLACACVWHPSFVNGDTDPNDASALNVLFVSLNSDSQLTGWKQNGGDPCGESWRGITCSGSAVTAIKLSGLRLNGTLGYNMNQMSSLTELDLSNNNLGNGVQIPYNIPTSLHRLDLSNNQFGQSLPYIISQMLSLEYLNVAHNRLQGNLGDMFGSLSNLVTLDLSFNSLNGNLPQSFSSLTSLTSLYLQNNQFTGHIDVLANLPLQNLNVENNQFTGWIPNQLKGINNLRIGNNQWSSGPAPPPPPYMPPPPSRKSNPGQESGGGGGGGIGGGGIAGIIISLLVVGGVIVFFVIKKKSRKHSTEESPEQDQPFAHLASESIKEMKTIQTPSVIDIEKLPPPAPVSLKPPPIDRYKSFDEDDFSNKPSTKKGNTASVKAVSYSVADLQMATDSFSEDNIVGEGSFGRVYKAQFSDGKLLAVKKLNSTALPTRSTDDFLELVISLSRLHHPNLTELVGYCSEYGQRLLVYDFHKNGSLYEQLQVTDEPLPWNARVKIALGTARALEYLHEVCSPSVVHKKLKSSNILLDAELNPHLSDCGLDKLVPNVDFQASEFNMGYTAPEVALSGQCTLKSDVYSFGVVMLELMTGRKPFDSSKPRSEQSLVLWATPQLHDIDALERMVDPGLKGLYPSKSLSRFADVIALCVQSEPEFRPPMSEVVQDLVRLVKRAKVNTRMPSDFGQETSRRGDDMDNYML